MALKWGICSAGHISQDFVTALKLLPVGEHEVVAVAARSLSSAQQFAETFNVARAYEGYEHIAQDPNVEIAYIGNLIPQHYATAKLMLDHGKHVLCEKPLTLCPRQTAELLQLARDKKVFFQEAIWSRSFPIYKKLRAILDAGVIGDVQQVIAAFGIPLQDTPKLCQKELGGGTILDLGVYPLQFQQFVFGGGKPEKVIVAGTLNASGVDVGMNAVISYGNGRMASLLTNSVIKLNNEAIIMGTTGMIKVPDMWCPEKLILPDGEVVECPLPGADLKFNYYHSAGLHYEANEVRDCIRNGLLENPSLTHAESVELALLEAELHKQLGVDHGVH